jgi:hypothetical protein
VISVLLSRPSVERRVQRRWGGGEGTGRTGGVGRWCWAKYRVKVKMGQEPKKQKMSGAGERDGHGPLSEIYIF